MDIEYVNHRLKQLRNLRAGLDYDIKNAEKDLVEKRHNLIENEFLTEWFKRKLLELDGKPL